MKKKTQNQNSVLVTLISGPSSQTDELEKEGGHACEKQNSGSVGGVRCSVKLT